MLKFPINYILRITLDIYATFTNYKAIRPLFDGCYKSTEVFIGKFVKHKNVISRIKQRQLISAESVYLLFCSINKNDARGLKW